MAVTSQQLQYDAAEWTKRLQSDVNAQPPKAFIDEVIDWLLFTRDPRLDFTGPQPRILHVFGTCADFCRLMERCATDGFEESNWREYLSLDQARADLAVPAPQEKP